MTTIHIQLDDEVYQRLETQAQREGRSVEAAAAERLGTYSAPAQGVEEGGREGGSQKGGEPLWGMFADEPELVDQVLVNIMRWREERNRAVNEGPRRFDCEHP